MSPARRVPDLRLAAGATGLGVWEKRVRGQARVWLTVLERVWGK